MTPRAGKTKKRTRIQELNETRILEAALEVFAAHGFRGSTIDQIAARAEMSKPNLLYYYRRKQDIYRAVLKHTLDDWLAPLQLLEPAGDPIEQISDYIRRKMEMSRNRPKASRLYANEMLHGAPMIGDVLEGPLKTLVDEKAAVIERWVKAGRLAPVDPYDLIFTIWAATQTYADFEAQILAVRGRVADAQWDAATSSVLTVFLDGIRPR